MESWEAATLGAAAMLLAIVLTRALTDRRGAITGDPTRRCVRALRRHLREIRHGHYGGLPPSLASSLMECLAEGRPATLYAWVSGAPARLCSCGDLHEPELATRLPAVWSDLRWGAICGDAHGMLVPLRTETGLLTGVLVLGPGQPPHPDNAQLLALAGNMLGRAFQPDEFDAARRSRRAAPDPGRSPASPDASPADATHAVA